MPIFISRFVKKKRIIGHGAEGDLKAKHFRIKSISHLNYKGY